MTGARLAAAATALAITAAALAGCGSPASSHPNASRRPVVKVTHGSPPSTSEAAITARANERQFAYWLAGSSQDPSSLRNAISGPVMQSYAQFEALFAEARAASGSPQPPYTVSTSSGGYQLCGTGSNGNSACESLTGFRTADAAGRITDFSVNGQLVSPRLATGPSNTGSQLSISDVVAYRLESIGEVVIAYRARNITDHVVGDTNPAFLAVFDPSGGGQFQEDDTNSTVPGSLQPGESAVEDAAFATQTLTGEFSLRTNNGYMAVLAASTLRMSGGSSPNSDTAEPTAPPVQAVSFACKVLQTNTGEEFSVTAVGSSGYAGTVYVSFYGVPGSGQIFPGTTVDGTTPAATWHQVPAADIGASAEPSSCSAAPG